MRIFPRLYDHPHLVKSLHAAITSVACVIKGIICSTLDAVNILCVTHMPAVVRDKYKRKIYIFKKNCTSDVNYFFVYWWQKIWPAFSRLALDLNFTAIYVTFIFYIPSSGNSHLNWATFPPCYSVLKFHNIILQNLY